jgi:lysophospholipase L1-like esterase
MLRPLDENSLQKSRKTVGNVYRFRNLLCKLWAGKPVRVLVLGGSNTKDAYLPFEEPPWPTVLEEWLNERFPISGNSSDGEARHVVVNRGSSGAGSCVNAPRLPMLMNKDSPFDLVLTEFGINDAQFAEQGTATTGFYAAPPYGDHYKQIAKCTEILIRNILNADPNTALVFLELPSW